MLDKILQKIKGYKSSVLVYSFPLLKASCALLEMLFWASTADTRKKYYQDIEYYLYTLESPSFQTTSLRLFLIFGPSLDQRSSKNRHPYICSLK